MAVCQYCRCVIPMIIISYTYTNLIIIVIVSSRFDIFFGNFVAFNKYLEAVITMWYVVNWFQILILETIGAFEILSNYSVVNYVSFISKIIEVGLRFFADLLAANLLAVAIITIIDLLKSKSKDPQCCGVRFDVQFELILIRLLLTNLASWNINKDWYMPWHWHLRLQQISKFLIGVANYKKFKLAFI